MYNNPIAHFDHTMMHTQDRHKGAPMMCYITAIPVAHMHIVVPCAISIYATQERYHATESPFLLTSNAPASARTHASRETHTYRYKG
jgi:hypothetical protein